MLNRRLRRSSQRAKPKSFKNSFLIAVFETCFILCSTPSRFVKTKPPFGSEKAEDVESCTRTVHLFVGRNRLFHAILHFRRLFLVSRKELSYSVISLTNSDNESDYKGCFLFCNGFFTRGRPWAFTGCGTNLCWNAQAVASLTAAPAALRTFVEARCFLCAYREAVPCIFFVMFGLFFFLSCSALSRTSPLQIPRSSRGMTKKKKSRAMTVSFSFPCHPRAWPGGSGLPCVNFKLRWAPFVP